MNLNVKMAVHNKFEIQVCDARTGEVKQEAEAFNVVTDTFFRARLNLLREEGKTMEMNCICVGDGTGTPSISDTSLFHELDFTYTETIEEVYQYPTSHITKRITIGVTELNGKTLTEVGLLMYNHSRGIKYLCSHAMIKDSEGQQIAIQKTDTDVVYITATFYCSYTASGFGNNGIYPEPTCNNLVRQMLGTLDYSINYIRAHSKILQNSSDLAWDYIRSKSFGQTTGTGDITNLRFVISETVITDTDFNTGLIRTFGVPGIGAFTFPDSSMFPDYDISHLSIGDGDGQQTEYSLQCPLIKSGTLHVYVDSIEQTEGVDYTADLTNNCIDTRSEYYTANMKVGETAVFGDLAERSPYTSTRYHDPFYWGTYPVSGYIYSQSCRITNEKPIWVDLGEAKACNRVRIDTYPSIYSTVLNNMVIEYSDDNETWNALTLTQTVSGSYQYLWTFPLTSARYWRMYSNGQNFDISLNSTWPSGRENDARSSSIFGIGKSVPGLTFTTPPATGKAVDASFKINVPYKTANNLMRFTCTVQMARG